MPVPNRLGTSQFCSISRPFRLQHGHDYWLKHAGNGWHNKPQCVLRKVYWYYVVNSIKQCWFYLGISIPFCFKSSPMSPRPLTWRQAQILEATLHELNWFPLCLQEHGGVGKLSICQRRVAHFNQPNIFFYSEIKMTWFKPIAPSINLQMLTLFPNITFTNLMYFLLLYKLTRQKMEILVPR